jgi:fructokinase
MPNLRFGIDLGGTKIESVALDDRGREQARFRTDAPQGSYQETLNALKAHIKELQVQTSAAGTIGMGIPGALDPLTGLVKNANSTWINGQALDKDLSALLDQQVRIANDANCFSLSEAADGAGEGARTVLGIIIGTGCGSGIVVDGRVLVGPNAISGEWGHNALPWPNEDEIPGPVCFCGLKGCVETWVSGTGFSHRFEEQTGLVRTAPEICAAANSGDTQALSALERYEDRFARALSATINILDPDVIVLGGGMSNISRIYKNVPPLLERHVMSSTVATRLVQNKHGDASGVRGAAWLWPINDQR